MAALLAGFCAHAVVPAAPAMTFTVNSTADAVDVAGGDGICAAASGACTLRAAVQEANLLPGADGIVVPAGTYRLMRTGSGEDAGGTGDLDVLDDLDVAGAGAEGTVLDGMAADRLIHVVGEHALALAGMTIRAGNAGASSGGGVGAPAGALSLRGVRFENNVAHSGGGVAHGNGTLRVTDCVFTGNIASGGNAAGLYKLGTGAVEIRGTRAVANHAVTGGDGGGAIIQNDTAVVVHDSVFSANTADSVGGLAVLSSGSLTLAASQVTDSVATNEVGGLYYSGPGPVTITGATISRNVAMSQTGGVFLRSTGNAINIAGSAVTDNVAGAIGGMFVLFTAGGLFTVRDTAVSGNTAVAGAAGGALVQGAIPMGFEDVLVSGNAGLVAGGLYLVGQTAVTIRRGRFVENRSGSMVGGLFDAGAGSTSIESSTFSGNLAVNGSGGGLYRLAGAGGLTITDSTFSDNVASGAGASGGGVFDSSPAASTVTNATFSGNWAETGGGFHAATPVSFTNCTFAGNGATLSAADIWDGGSVTLARTILADTAAGASCGGGAFASGGGNLNEDGSCLLGGPGDASGVDPQLGPLADNGGATRTRALAPASPAIDAAGGACSATDQRGVARPADGDGDGTVVCDAGAYEFVDECPADPAKTMAGACGCGVADVDANGNGAIDCLAGAELKARIARAKTLVAGLASDRTAAQRALRRALRAQARGLAAFVRTHGPAIPLADPGAKLPRLARRASAAVRSAAGARAAGLVRTRTRANGALDALDVAVAGPLGT